MLCPQPINIFFEIMRYFKHTQNISMNNKCLCFHHLDLTDVDTLTYLPLVFLFLLFKKYNWILFPNPFASTLSQRYLLSWSWYVSSNITKFYVFKILKWKWNDIFHILFSCFFLDYCSFKQVFHSSPKCCILLNILLVKCIFTFLSIFYCLWYYSFPNFSPFAPLSLCPWVVHISSLSFLLSIPFFTSPHLFYAC